MNKITVVIAILIACFLSSCADDSNDGEKEQDEQEIEISLPIPEWPEWCLEEYWTLCEEIE